MAMARVGTLGIPEMRAEIRGTTKTPERTETLETPETTKIPESQGNTKSQGTTKIPEIRGIIRSRGITRNREMVENRGTQEEEIGSGSDTETVTETVTVTVTETETVTVTMGATVIATVGEDTRELGTDEAANDWFGTKRPVDLLTCVAGLIFDAQSKRVLAPIDVEDQIFWGQFI